MKNQMIAVAVLTLLSFSQTRAQTTQPATRKAPTTEQIEKWHREAEDRLHNDWADLNHFKDANAKLSAAQAGEDRIVFMGDSITIGWIDMRPDFFKSGPYLDRGISGQTTPQMLVRFRADVIDLKPKVVVILAGTNDIAGNTGPATLEQIEGNLQSMAELAKAANIKVVLSSVLPVYDYPWKRGLNPVEKIAAVNAWMKNYCEKNDCVYLDYYAATIDDRKGFKHELTYDGVHPNAAGYAVMEPLAVAAIKAALGKK